MIAGNIRRFVRSNGGIDGVIVTGFIRGIEIGTQQTFSFSLPSIPAKECKRIIPSVKVPVLSEHSIFILPKFSIDARRLMMTFCSAMRLAPWDRLMLMITGNNCGVRPTARAREKSTESSNDLLNKCLLPGSPLPEPV